MNPFEELLLKLADGETLTPQEDAELAAGLADPRQCERAILLLELEVKLRAKTPLASVATATLARLHTLRAADSEALVEQVLARIQPADNEQPATVAQGPFPRKWLALAAGLTVGALLVFQGLGPKSPPQGLRVAAQADGAFSATINRQGQTLPARGRFELQPDDQITVTAGRVLFQFEESATRLELEPGASLRVTAVEPAPSFALQSGIATLQVAPRPAGSPPLRLSTPLAEVIVRGTRFRLEQIAGETSLSVTEGQVEFVRSGFGETLLVTAGNFAVITPGALSPLQALGADGFPPVAPGLVTQPARSADSFVDSLGVNIHLHYRDTVYHEFGKVMRALRDLGVRQVRDALVDTDWPLYYDRHKKLAAVGIRTTFITNLPTDRILPVAEKLASAIGAFEGPNEVNLNGWSVENARQAQRELWQTIKASGFAQTPVLALSVTDAEWAKQLGDLSAWCDFGNAHPYAGGWFPENTAAWMGGDLTSGLRSARTIGGTQPIIATEIGYHNASARQGNGHVPISEEAAGIYLPRLFLNNYRSGIVRTFWYELMNSGPNPASPEENFGLYANDGQSPKPAARALRSLTALLADPGPAFTVGTLPFSLSETKVQSVLLQKRNGEFWLALWLPSSLWDDSRTYGQKQEIDPPDLPCTVTLHRPAAVTLHSQLAAVQPQRAVLATPGSFELTVSERVLLLQITPRPGR